MAIILPHGVLFHGGAEEGIREKLLKDNNIDTVIGLGVVNEKLTSINERIEIKTKEHNE